MKILYYFLLIFCWELLSGNIEAQEKPNLNVSVIPDAGTNDTKFFIQVAVTGKDLSTISVPEFSDNANFEVAMSSSSIQKQDINGQQLQQKTFIFSLKPKSFLKEGDYPTPNGTIQFDGQKYRLPTRQLRIESTRQFLSSVLDSPTKDGFNFVQVVSNEKPYVGEQVSYKVEIIAPPNLVNAELEDFQLDGIWREKFGQDEKKQRQSHNITIHSFSEAWFPIRSGLIDIPGRNLQVSLQEVKKIPSGLGLSNHLLGSLIPLISQLSTEEKILSSPPLQLDIQALPPAPKKIIGYVPVGKLNVSSRIDSETGKVGEPIVLSIQVHGDANLRPLELTKPINMSDEKKLRKYEDKPIFKRDITGSEVVFYKTFNVTFIPLVSGELEIPRYEINWFDPNDKFYHQAISIEKSINIIGDSVSLIESAPQEELEIDRVALRKIYGKHSLNLNRFYSLAAFILSLLTIFAYSTYEKVSSYKVKSLNSKKHRILSELKSFSNLKNPSTGIAIFHLRKALSIFLNKNAQALTITELVEELKPYNIFNEQELRLLLDAELNIYSSKDINNSGDISSYKNLIQKMAKHV